MDEPFSALAEEDTENLIKIMDSLRRKGVSIIYIDHRIENFFRIGDRITIFRDGTKVDTRDISELNKEDIIRKMVGRNIENIFPKYNKVDEDVMLEVKDVSNNRLKNISFSVKKGEIFSLGGLVGAGRSEIFKAIVGRDPKKSGKIFIVGKEIKIKKINHAIGSGIAYLPEDRKLQSLVLGKSVRFNGTLVCIDAFRKGLFINEKKEKKTMNDYVESLNIKTSGTNKIIKDLSGGNQQKVIIARWLMMDSLKVLLLDEPTRGIDVGAKFEIYKLINDLANQGISIVLITSELTELLGLCDRIAVVKNGEITAILDRNDMYQERIMINCV